MFLRGSLAIVVTSSLVMGTSIKPGVAHPS